MKGPYDNLLTHYKSGDYRLLVTALVILSLLAGGTCLLAAPFDAGVLCGINGITIGVHK